MEARSVIFEYLLNDYPESNPTLCSLMDYLDTDTLVAWFVDEGYVDYLDDTDKEDIVNHHYELHCGR